MKKYLLLFSISIIGFGCQKSEKELSLPFFNSADFSPEWIDKESKAFEEIHTIDRFSFLNQNGEEVTNFDLEGKIYVADFFFTICPSICPKMTSNLATIQDSFNPEEVKLLSFSVMPWADSVSVLHNYAEVRGIDSKQWNLLTGDTDKIYDLARKSFFAEKEIGLNKDSNEFLHTENFILVDGKGRIRGVYNGTLPLEMTRLKEDIKTLLEQG
ncbi:MAG: SCO family protein [Cytophagia bacterium]|nr:SCO family protein [Cytophagia bacterium]